MKLQKLIFIILITFFFNGCSSVFTSKDNGDLYAQSYGYNDIAYIDYEFQCSNCYYEMYYCFNCNNFHVRINHWCNRHYHWYVNWYMVYHHQYHGYYHRHYTHHHNYRDVTRVYVRDRNGFRNRHGRGTIKHDVIKDNKRKRTIREGTKIKRRVAPKPIIKKDFKVYKKKRQRPNIKRNKIKRKAPVYKQKRAPVKRYSTFKKQGKRNVKVYRKSPNVQKKRATKRSSNSRKNRKR